MTAQTASPVKTGRRVVISAGVEVEGRCPAKVKTRATKMDVTDESHAESKQLCLLTGVGVGGELDTPCQDCNLEKAQGLSSANLSH